LPVSATATFTTGNGTVLITLTNTQVNPTSVVQNLSDLSFTVITGQTTQYTGTLTSSSGFEWTVYSGGSFSNGSAVATGWALSTVASQLELSLLGTATAPEHTIIGPPDILGTYSNANASIAGNGPHNPFLGGPVTFNLSVPGATADSTITSATFSFGTTAGNNVAGNDSPSPSPVPEPSALLLMGSGLLALGGRMRGRLRR
jgi:hypothetical protein